MQFNPYLLQQFVSKLGSFNPNILQTRLILVTDEGMPLKQIVTAIKTTLQSLGDGARTVGLASYRHVDASISPRPFVGGPDSSYYYKTTEYVQNGTRFEALLVRAPS